MKVIKFTRKSPPCPKCGGITKRVFYKTPGSQSVLYTAIEFLPDGEYLRVVCQSCHYDFAQYPKDHKP